MNRTRSRINITSSQNSFYILLLQRLFLLCSSNCSSSYSSSSYTSSSSPPLLFLSTSLEASAITPRSFYVVLHHIGPPLTESEASLFNTTTSETSSLLSLLSSLPDYDWSAEDATSTDLDSYSEEECLSEREAWEKLCGERER